MEDESDKEEGESENSNGDEVEGQRHDHKVLTTVVKDK
jgi:hypothetical protein